MSPSSRRIPDPLLERYLAGALTGEALANVKRLLDESEADRARVAELEADGASFLTQHPPGQMVARFEKEQERRRAFWRIPLLVGPGLAAAAAAVLLVVSPREDELTAKGAVTLTVHRRRGDASAPLRPGEPLSPGEAVRFEVHAPRGGYVAIVSRDAGGQVTVYYPYGGAEAAPYDPGQSLLPGAIELDEVRGREQLYALFGERPFALGWAKSALVEGRALEEVHPRGVAVARTEIDKR